MKSAWVLAIVVAASAAGCSGGGSTSGSVTTPPPAPVLTAIKAPECVADPARAFVTQNVEPVSQVYPTMPNEGYYLVVRYLGGDSIAAAPAFDYGRYPADWPVAALRGQPITGLTVPEPRAAGQRARTADATPDTSSAFQLACADAGSYLDTATFPRRDVIGGGPHAVYGFAFNNPSPQPVFETSLPGDFILQASLEIPRLRVTVPAGTALTFEPVGQVSLFAYFRERTTRKVFALLVAIFDNRFGTADPYAPFVAHDTQTPFASQPLGSSAAPYFLREGDSQSFTGTPWAGLRPFRARLTQQHFARIVADVNAWCRDHRSQRFCDAPSADAPAFSASPFDYEITDFGMLHEVFPGRPAGDLAMGVHVSSLGAWRLR